MMIRYIYSANGYTFIDILKTYYYQFQNREQTSTLIIIYGGEMTEIKKNYIYEVHNISEMDRILTVEDRAIFKELYEAGYNGPKNLDH